MSGHHDKDVRFASKCAGCSASILNGFVETERNECWHPECYKIHRAWDIGLATRVPADLEVIFEELAYAGHEQVQNERTVHRIWTVLSAFENSLAECILNIRKAMNDERYLDAVQMAGKLILRIEVLFATTGDLDFHFSTMHPQRMSYIDGARKICRRIVDLFAVVSPIQGTVFPSPDISGFSKGLAQDLKAFVRIAISSALELNHETKGYALEEFLNKLSVEAVNTSARKIIDNQYTARVNADPSIQGVISPEIAAESLFNGEFTRSSNADLTLPTDLCVKCGKVVEEECVRLGTYRRWHAKCIECIECGKTAVVTPSSMDSQRNLANVHLFVYELNSDESKDTVFNAPIVILCTDHAHAGCCRGFKTVQVLEQYTFLLNVALRRLYVSLRRKSTEVSVGNFNRDQDPPRHFGNALSFLSGSPITRGSGLIFSIHVVPRR
ncbi:hypothetical protein J3R30DRAFT_3707750 [Lentinula aciculospora]|uniref:LIM zinc-binding domain-containing protein n=1 Tax=Lentinula aciculospora TaxID=153920 RepID=A0A9W9A3P9_9AGAR|nr:hypothetical protein J3R30DRAFT_3707750 [Lentinula aciculospora]